MRMICTRESSPTKIGKTYSGSFALVSRNMIKHRVILFFDGRFFEGYVVVPILDVPL